MLSSSTEWSGRAAERCGTGGESARSALDDGTDESVHVDQGHQNVDNATDGAGRPTAARTSCRLPARAPYFIFPAFTRQFEPGFCAWLAINI